MSNSLKELPRFDVGDDSNQGLLSLSDTDSNIPSLPADVDVPDFDSLDLPELPELPEEEMAAINVIMDQNEAINANEQVAAKKYISDIIESFYIGQALKTKLNNALGDVIDALRAPNAAADEPPKFTSGGKLITVLFKAKKKLADVRKQVRKDISSADTNSVLANLKKAASDAYEARRKAKTQQAKEQTQRTKEQTAEMLSVYNKYIADLKRYLGTYIRKELFPQQPKLSVEERVHIGRKSIEKPKRNLIDEPCVKGKCGWEKRTSLKDLSRDELMLILHEIKTDIRALRESDPDQWKEMRVLYKQIQPKTNKWRYGTYLKVVTQLLTNPDIRILNPKFTIPNVLKYYNEHPNTDVYNKIYSRCYVYSLITITNVTTKTKRTLTNQVDKKYTGRPGDAPLLFLTELLVNHKNQLIELIPQISDNNIKKIIDNDNKPPKFNVNIEFVRVTRGDPKLAKIDKNCTFKYNLQGEFKIKSNADGKHDVKIDYISVKTTADKTDKQRRKGKNPRQVCEYKDALETSCVPRHRRNDFLNQQTMKSYLKRPGAVSPVKTGKRPGSKPQKQPKKSDKLSQEQLIIKSLIDKFDSDLLIKPQTKGASVKPMKWLTFTIDELQEQESLLVNIIAKNLVSKDQVANKKVELIEAAEQK
ncbi:hypothetical protein, partial [Flavobacterium sp.]|uniref:hypothetical protein n=1 Tax=Flavobacterium sp. TaxID=239 RepID=UPI0037518D34